MRPLTPPQVEQRLADLLDRLENGVKVVAAADGEATRLRREYDRAYALAFINAEGSMDIRRYVAVEQTIGQREAAEIAEVALRHAKTLLSAVRDEVEIMRSISASVRTSLVAS